MKNVTCKLCVEYTRQHIIVINKSTSHGEKNYLIPLPICLTRVYQ